MSARTVDIKATGTGKWVVLVNGHIVGAYDEVTALEIATMYEARP